MRVFPGPRVAVTTINLPGVMPPGATCPRVGISTQYSGLNPLRNGCACAGMTAALTSGGASVTATPLRRFEWRPKSKAIDRMRAAGCGIFVQIVNLTLLPGGTGARADIDTDISAHARGDLLLLRVGSTAAAAHEPCEVEDCRACRSGHEKGNRSGTQDLGNTRQRRLRHQHGGASRRGGFVRRSARKCRIIGEQATPSRSRVSARHRSRLRGSS